MTALDPNADRARNPLDEPEESGARGFRPLKELEPRRRDGLDAAQLRGGGAEFFVEDGIPAIAGVGDARRVGAARALWIRADFGGERCEAVGIGAGVKRSEIVGGGSEGARFLMDTREQDAALG